MTLSYSHAHQQGSGTTEVVAVLIAITDHTARVLTVDQGKLLPNGPLMPLHRSLQSGVRQWVEEQTQQQLGYLEQLYTFVDTNRRNIDGHALVYVSYLGLVQETQTAQLQSQALWCDWYDYFPWENHLNGEPEIIKQMIVPALSDWAKTAVDAATQHRRQQRICLCWGVDDKTLDETANNQKIADMPHRFGRTDNSDWVAEHVLLRYEMLYEAGLIQEASNYQPNKLPADWSQMIGAPMYYDHRRVIATAISRLRAKIEYRPLIFGLMPDVFTLLQLQQSVEALSGVRLHKQNFRRLLDSQNLVMPTGNSSSAQRGRPAKLYRFCHDIELQSLLMDSKLPKRK
ncbi:NrtR DNA-binding winged helix domain-containing protein [Psychrobacter sp. CAL346-MNA-CIBAN-0220]|uniref:NUDIX hydrolase n=1 Tax=Psychrobacter sp. CAL346-MNA-CIBAN-0220 TaxID=3140457 RepID=UPI003321E44B